MKRECLELYSPAYYVVGMLSYLMALTLYQV